MSDYSSTYPTQSPVFAFDAKAGKLDSRISYSRSSTGTYLSNEKALNSENLLLQSQDFDTTWTKAALNAPTGSQTAPDGTSTAWLLTTAASGTGSPFLFQNPSGAVSNNTVCTYVVHLKAGTASHAYFSFRGASSSAAWALIDFASPTSPTTGGSLGSISATSVALGSSWYRFALTFNTGTISSGYPYLYIGASDGTAPNSTGRVSYTYAGETLYAWGAQLSSTNSKVYDSPTTTQISREYSPLLKTAAADAARFEYAADGQSEGLLIEAQATNLQTYSSDFTSWSGQNRVTTTANVAIAPNGLLEADIVIANTSSTQSHNLSNTLLLASGTTYTASVYAKDAGQRYIQLSGSTGAFGSSQYATFDLQTGSVDTTGVTASAVSVGNGWYRIQATMTATASVTGGVSIGLANSATASRLPLFAGNEYDGVLCWGFQTEVGSSASSIISTSGAAATRSADSCSVADFGYTGGPISITAEANTSDVSSASKILFRYDGGDVYTNYFQGSLLVNYVTAGASTQALQYPSSVTAGTDYKVASRVDTNSINSAANGTAQAADTSAVLPDLAGATLHIGGISGSQCLNGNLKNLKVFSAPLTDTNLTAITS